MDATMKSLGDEYWRLELANSPTQALMLGYHEYGSQHEDLSREAEDAQIAALRDLVARAEAIDPGSLDGPDRVSREVLIFDAGTNADMLEHRTIEHGVSHTVGIQAMLPVIPPQLPIIEPEHADNLVSKYRELARSFDQHTNRLEAGLEQQKAPIASTVAKTIDQFDAYLATVPAESLFMNVRVPGSFDDQQQTAWMSRLAEVVAEYLYPAMQRHRDVLQHQVLAAGRSDEQPGIMHLPGGSEFYATAIHRYTSLNRSAEDIHRIGLEQVAQLNDEYRELGAEVLDTTDLTEIYRRLRDDPQLHFDNGPDIVAASEIAMAKARAAIPDWFGRLPKAECLVAETTSGPEAFYIPPAPDGSRPGTFFVNTKDPSGWGRFQIEAMAYHEGIPGHHMQLAIAQELEDQPEFRKHAGITAYAEGWGLYTERLADEMGLYSRPLDRIGMLAADSLRAGRLVVDTGMHAMGWTRQQAIDFFAENSPMTMTSIHNEVDRYISMPGQALAYMIGRLEIMSMRAAAQQTMGSRFDIKGFHDTVLGDGMVPLPTLDRLVREWAAQAADSLPAVVEDSPSNRLASLADDYWEHISETSPTSSLLRGDGRFTDRWEDLSRQAEDRTIETLQGFAAAAEAIDPSRLSDDEQITRSTLIAEATRSAEVLGHRHAEFAVDHSTSGLHVTLLQLVPMIRLANAAQADALVTRWGATGELFDQAIKRLRQGIAGGRTPNRLAVERSIAQLDAYLATDITTDPFLTVPAPATMSEAEADAWQTRIREQVEHTVRPAFAAYRSALADEVLEKARPVERPGLRWIERGEEAYAVEIKRHTSLDLTPMEIHQIGLDDIERLGDEYRELGSKVLGTSDLAAIYDRLRNDPSLRFETPEQIVAAAQSAMDRAGKAIPDWFGRLPKADCVMAEMGVGAEDSTIAYYLPPATDGSRPGTYFVNTTDPTTRTRFESEALAFHESIPGHHLQIAIAQELEGIPEFRKHALMTAYVEGWGLYTERLSDEMGLYTDDTTRLGILSFDSWRAGRLVVDTGLHALGWSRQEAIDFLVANSPLALNNIANEVDRYIAMPGQALAYKLGQREILRLREEARRTMGDRFDIRGFHDAVLGSGPVSLGILGDLIRKWTAQ